ncbi:carboxypeptidase regulatory-like domain-containing protein [Dermatophilaceae bacterium Soc4.6]
MTDHLDPYAADAALDAAAAGSIDTLDEVALTVLRAVHERRDPVPAGLVERVQFAISLDHLEAEVAQLQRTGAPELVSRSDLDRVDGAQKAHSVTFTSDTVTTMVTITPVDAASVRLDGWAAPGAGLRVELRLGDRSHHTTADEDGRFVFDQVEHGMAQLVLRPGDPTSGQRPVVTPALEI